MVECQPSKLAMRVRFPSPAPFGSPCGPLTSPTPSGTSKKVTLAAPQAGAMIGNLERKVSAVMPGKDDEIVVG
jgi:hypothetical protein